MPCRVCPANDSLVARAIALAVSHPFGIGDAKYRLGNSSAPQEVVDTVAFACFRKSWWEQLGGFNEELLTNEDYDFNYRTRLRGGQVLLDRSGYCHYFARSTFRSLGAQYFRYGCWKARMVKLHPRSIKLRHTVAPAFVAGIILLGVLGFIWTVALELLGLGLVTYLITAIIFGVHATRRDPNGLMILTVMPIAFGTIHLTWGTSFLLGLVRPSR
jgi:GT2 family glycosyltransferase